MSATLARKQQLKSLYNKQDGCCFYCGIKTELPYPTPRGVQYGHFATIDHYVATCLGGDDAISNKVMACMGCNSSKGCLSHEEFDLMNMIRPANTKKIDWVWDTVLA